MLFIFLIVNCSVYASDAAEPRSSPFKRKLGAKKAEITEKIYSNCEQIDDVNLNDLDEELSTIFLFLIYIQS